MLVPWTPLQPSARARNWRRAAFGIALTSAAALFAAALSGPFDARLAGLACIAAAFAAARARAGTDLEIGVSSLGQVMARSRDPAAAHAAFEPLRIAFAAPWLISLRCGTMLISVWPDSLPQSIYRRLWVHYRWGRVMPSDDDRAPMPATRADSTDR